MDTAAAMAVWMRRGRFVPHATLDLRLDHLRSEHPGATLIARAECYRIDGPLAFARGIAYDGDRTDPVVHLVGSFMAFEA
jgi:acyl-coenzyme A thioesterase PaaI-like protein